MTRPEGQHSSPAGSGVGSRTGTRHWRVGLRRDLGRLRRLAAHSGTLREMAVRVAQWGIDGYRRVNAGDLAAALAFNAMMAIVPTILLLITVAGVLLRSDQLYRETLVTAQWLLPAGMSQESTDALIGARSRSGIFGLASFAGFLWIGAAFFACLGRTMNSVYGVENPPPVQQRVRGFLVVVAFAVLFILTVIAAVLPSIFLGSADDLPIDLSDSLLAQGLYQVLSYVIAVLTAMVLFGMLFRVVPNANQRIGDVLPGTVVIAVAFVLLVQAFPLYFRVVRNLNGIESTFAFLPLLLIWFYILAHLLLFGAFINASYQQFRRRHVRVLGKRVTA